MYKQKLILSLVSVMDKRPKTLFIDIDGTLFFHSEVRTDCAKSVSKAQLLPGVLDKFNEWDKLGYKIILVTGRRESDRYITEQQLRYYGIFYDQLVMGITGGERILINDTKPASLESTARAFTIPRNEGIKDLDI